MAFVFNAILGHPLQNSYVSVSQADDYFASRVESSIWDGLTVSADKQAALTEASRLIDTLPLKRLKLFSNQGLQFPSLWHLYLYGTVDSASNTTSFIDATLTDATTYYDDQFIHGTIRITSGTGSGDCRSISDFVALTGTITVSTAFSATLDATSQYTLVYPLPTDFVAAVCEQALWCAEKIVYIHADKIGQGIVQERAGEYNVSYGLNSTSGKASPNVISPVTMQLIRNYLDHQVSMVGR